MKILVAAMTLVLAAAPAVAQTAPAQHQDHQRHQAAQHAQHAQHQAGHAAQHSQHQPGQHEGHNMQSGCCADRNGNGRMDCCENMAQGHREHGDQPATQPAQPSGHQNH